ncbi:hypothetical protein [Nocardia sp. NPDC004415]
MTINDTSPSGLWQAACDGRFRLEADAARECAAHYAWLADQIDLRIAEAEKLSKLAGFGGFDSAQQLQSGFEQKADQGVIAMRSVKVECRELQAAVLRAGGLLAEQDFSTAVAIVGRTESLS